MTSFDADFNLAIEHRLDFLHAERRRAWREHSALSTEWHRVLGERYGHLAGEHPGTELPAAERDAVQRRLDELRHRVDAAWQGVLEAQAAVTDYRRGLTEIGYRG
ncbi:hypothetical protein ACIRN4_25200 [Pimelobacter simplex]|uniref:hypothetical protein n=1 Tax=Nocardioides simplex TaxID=2045 RepID=UPI0037F10D04